MNVNVIWQLTISIITLNTNRQYKTNVATRTPNAAPISLYKAIYCSIKKAIISLDYFLYCHIPETIINMSTIKDDKKGLKDLLLSLNSHLKKPNLDRRTSNSKQSITHIIFGDRNVVQMF